MIVEVCIATSFITFVICITFAHFPTSLSFGLVLYYIYLLVGGTHILVKGVRSLARREVALPARGDGPAGHA